MNNSDVSFGSNGLWFSRILNLFAQSFSPRMISNWRTQREAKVPPGVVCVTNTEYKIKTSLAICDSGNAFKTSRIIHEYQYS